MDRDLFRFDERYYHPRRKTNYFAWAITLLLLIGFAFAAWLGSFYIFGQPERPDSYRILKKLHKIDPPRRFELTAAPKGEFLNAKQIYERYSNMRPVELQRANAELARNYIRNFQQVRGLVPYVVGRYDIMEARELGPNDLFPSGMVALTRAVDRGELLMEHIYSGDAHDVPLMKQTLERGLEIKLERTHDLSAILHAERLTDGRLLITSVPLLYGTYTMTHGTATFSLEPPNDLNFAAGWPLFKDDQRRKAEIHYTTYLASAGQSPGGSMPIAGITSNANVPGANELVRVESALPPETPKVAAASPQPKTETPSSTPASKEIAQTRKITPTASPSATQIAIAKKTTPTPAPILPSPSPIIAKTSSTPKPAASATPALAVAHPTATPPTVRPALPVTEADENALASTAGGGSWRIFEPGRMPAGRLVGVSDLSEVAERGTAGERYYLKGQFVVNFAEANRAVLRPRSKLPTKIFDLGAHSTRVIVEFPAGYPTPPQGSTVSRDETRPYEITEVRKDSEGQINVFVREIIQP
jgi:hypothetical protein